MVLDLLADSLGTSFHRDKDFHALMGQVYLEGRKILLVKPQTYMNNSGLAVASLSRWYRIAPDEIVVVYDDIDLEIGRLRIRRRGSAGGHRGLLSIINSLETTLIPRVKIGIGRNKFGEDIVDYVLQPFSKEEWETISLTFIKAVQAVRFLLEDGSFEKAMDRFNE